MDDPKPAMKPGRFSMESITSFVKNYWSDYVILFLAAVIIVGSDQWAKVLVRANVPLGGDWLPSWLAWLMPYARIRYWYNSGAAFGLFQNGNLVFTTLAIVVAGAILYFLPRTSRKDWWLRLALALQFSGAIGNLVDRLQFGHVTDFISVGNFAIFNIADASISVGVAVLVLGVWINESAEKRRLGAKAAELSIANENEVRVSSKDEGKGE
jgi:signal peptidase II